MCTDITEIIRKIFRKTSIIFNFKKFFFFPSINREERSQNKMRTPLWLSRPQLRCVKSALENAPFLIFLHTKPVGSVYFVGMALFF